jgi:hypothetical protein
LRREQTKRKESLNYFFKVSKISSKFMATKGSLNQVLADACFLFLVIQRTFHQKKPARKAMSVSIRCEQSTESNSLDVWLGRLAMIGFAVAISVEITTGKGLLEVCHMLWVLDPSKSYLLSVSSMVFSFSNGCCDNELG